MSTILVNGGPRQLESAYTHAVVTENGPPVLAFGQYQWRPRMVTTIVDFAG